MEIPRHWRLRKQRYGLVGEVCPHCEAKLFPPRDVCPECGQEAKTLYNFSGRGEVYSYTTETTETWPLVHRLRWSPVAYARTVTNVACWYMVTSSAQCWNGRPCKNDNN
jgi:uncharacterized OB-fold protein